MYRNTCSRRNIRGIGDVARRNLLLTTEKAAVELRPLIDRFRPIRF